MQAKYLKVQSVKPNYFIVTAVGPSFMVDYFYPDSLAKHVITNDKDRTRYFDTLRGAKTVCSSINKAAPIEVQ